MHYYKFLGHYGYTESHFYRSEYEKVSAKSTYPKIIIFVSFDPMEKPSRGFVPFVERRISTRGSKKLIFSGEAISIAQKLLRLFDTA